MKKFKDFYEAFWFLCEHPKFTYTDPEFKDLFPCGSFTDCLDIDVKKVNPKTKRIDNNEKLNTHVEIWLECGEYIWEEHLKKYVPCHDYNLDCGGDTFEEAIINLANLVLKYYGKGK